MINHSYKRNTCNNFCFIVLLLNYNRTGAPVIPSFRYVSDRYQVSDNYESLMSIPVCRIDRTRKRIFYCLNPDDLQNDSSTIVMNLDDYVTSARSSLSTNCSSTKKILRAQLQMICLGSSLSLLTVCYKIVIISVYHNRDFGCNTSYIPLVLGRFNRHNFQPKHAVS